LESSQKLFSPWWKLFSALGARKNKVKIALEAQLKDIGHIFGRFRTFFA
jgi:hypothetical protein